MLSPVDRGFEIAQREFTQVEMLDQRNLADSVARAIRMNRLKTFGDFTFHHLPLLRFEIGPFAFPFFLLPMLPLQWESPGRGGKRLTQVTTMQRSEQHFCKEIAFLMLGVRHGIDR